MVRPSRAGLVDAMGVVKRMLSVAFVSLRGSRPSDGDPGSVSRSSSELRWCMMFVQRGAGTVFGVHVCWNCGDLAMLTMLKTSLAYFALVSLTPSSAETPRHCRRQAGRRGRGWVWYVAGP